MDNIEVGHVGNGADGGIEALQLDHGVAQGVIVVDADVGEIEQVLAGGMAQLIIQRDVFLPVGGGNSDDLRAPLLGLHDGVNGSGVGADVVINNQHVILLEIVIFHDGAAIIDAALQRQVLLRLVEHGQAGLHAGVDVAQAAGAEEHLADRQSGVTAAAVDVDQTIVLNGIGHQLCGGTDVVVLLRFDFVEQLHHLGQITAGLIHSILSSC